MGKKKKRRDAHDPKIKESRVQEFKFVMKGICSSTDFVRKKLALSNFPEFSYMLWVETDDFLKRLDGKCGEKISLSFR